MNPPIKENEPPTQFGLCAGIGGFELAYESEGFRTVGISEICPDANAVTAHHFPDVPNFGDLCAERVTRPKRK